MSEIKLLPCPFCGGKVEMVKSFSMVINYIQCEECLVDFMFCQEEDDVIKLWNNRKPMQEIVERLEDEVTALKTKCYVNVEFDTGIFKAIEIVKEVGGMNE